MKIIALKYFLFISILTIIFSQSTFGQDQTVAPKYSNEFLQIGVGAEALGRSNAVVASSEGVSSVYWNPAGLSAKYKWLEVAAMHSEYFAGIAKYDYLGASHSLDSSRVIGISFIRFAVDNIPNTTQLIDNNGVVDFDKITLFSAADYAFGFSYSERIKRLEGLRVGGTVKVIHRTVGDFAHSWGIGFDAGLQYDYKKYLKFGLMARDVSSTFNAWIFTLDDATKKVFETTGNRIPSNGLELTLPRFIFGSQFSYPLGSKGSFVATELDVDLTTDGKRNVLMKSGVVSIDPHIGMEFGFRNLFYVRAGVGNIQKAYTDEFINQYTFQPNLGIGVAFYGINLDYAFTDIGDQSTALYSHVFSLKFKLDKNNSTLK